VLFHKSQKIHSKIRTIKNIHIKSVIKMYTISNKGRGFICWVVVFLFCICIFFLMLMRSLGQFHLSRRGGLSWSVRDERFKLGDLNGWMCFCEMVYYIGNLVNEWWGFFEIRVRGGLPEGFVMRRRQIDWNDWNILILDFWPFPISVLHFFF